jgi:hypothetical protein
MHLLKLKTASFCYPWNKTTIHQGSISQTAIITPCKCVQSVDICETSLGSDRISFPIILCRRVERLDKQKHSAHCRNISVSTAPIKHSRQQFVFRQGPNYTNVQNGASSDPQLFTQMSGRFGGWRLLLLSVHLWTQQMVLDAVCRMAHSNLAYTYSRVV